MKKKRWRRKKFLGFQSKRELTWGGRGRRNCQNLLAPSLKKGVTGATFNNSKLPEKRSGSRVKEKKKKSIEKRNIGARSMWSLSEKEKRVNGGFAKRTGT